MNDHLETFGLMDVAQRGACAGCSGTIHNLLIDRTVTLDCHRQKRNLSMVWIDAKKAYDSVDHGWLEEMMILHTVQPKNNARARTFCVRKPATSCGFLRLLAPQSYQPQELLCG